MEQVSKVALCITNYNRFEMLFNAFRGVLRDERISRVIISDDHSDPKIFDQVCAEAQILNDRYGRKIQIVRPIRNLGCYHNKAHALQWAQSEYAILFDSDNTITTAYLDALFAVPPEYWDGRTILAPDFAKPSFDYRKFAASYLNKDTIKQHIPTMDKTQFDCLINCANYVVPVKEYLNVFDPTVNPWTADTIYMLYKWLEAGNAMYVVPGMQYDHLIHDGSHYRQHVSKTGNLFKETADKILSL